MTRSEEPKDCVFCVAQSIDDGRALMLHAGPLAYVILNKYPYNAGHLMVVPQRHAASLALLSRDELTEMALLTQLSERVLTEAFAPQGINVGMNLGRPAGAGIVDHLHVHLVPRWNGDTNFMTVVGEVRVLPEELPATAQRLRPIFKRLSS
ncbi:MAG TPA: HIT domain-containing protein [Vicinamibacterales bacterium]|nr:HIT domain-containing protein [Vicinamibacterales bacterium]